jgi:glutathione S-transferase
MMVYGGPKTSPKEPSPEAVKIAESMVLVEFVNELSGNALLPKDPVLRAKARFFIETVSSKIIPAFFDVHMRGKSPEFIVSAIEVLQDLLPAEGYAVGEWSMADAAVVTFVARAEVGLKNDLGAYDEGTGTKAWDKLETSPKFERFRKWYADVKRRKSFQDTYDEVRTRFLRA